MFQLIAPVITKPAAVFAVAGLLVIWALWSGALFYVRTRTLTAALDAGAKLVSSIADRVDFAARYEKISAGLRAIPVLRPRWQEFADSLVMPAKPGRPVRSTTRPGEWFDMGLLRSREVGIDERYHAALPNLLVGAGLLFTFLGLAVALSTASGIVSGAADVRSEALRGLLDTASFKFITSLVGLGLSIAYSIFRKARLRRVEAALDHFLALIEERIPLLTAVALQQEANALIERQLTYTESLATDLSLALQQAVDQAFDQRLGEHIGPLREAMEKLSARISSGNEEAIAHMLDTFLSRLQGGAGDRMQDVATSLQGLGARLEGLQSGLGDAALRMAQSADAMATRMGEGAEAALTRITDQMAGLAETLRGVAQQTRDSGAAAGRELAEQIGAAAAGFEAASRGVAESLARAAAGLEARMGEQAEASAGRLNLQIARMIGELQTLAENSRATGAEALGAVADKVAASASGFEEMAGRISVALNEAAANTGGALGKGADEAVQRIAAATEGMRAELAALIADLRASAAAAGDTLRSGGEEGAVALKSALGEAGSSVGAALSQAADRIVSAGDAAGSSLKSGGEEAARSLVEAGSGFGGRADSLGAQVVALTRAAEGVVGRMTDLNAAARDAATPLSKVSSDLQSVGNALRDVTSPLASTARAVSQATEQLSGAMQRMEATQASAGRLAESVRGAADRFSGLDKELSNVLGELQAGLQGFAKEVSRCVRETDGKLAEAVTQLHRLVDDLQTTIEDSVPPRPAVSGATKPR